ncbi:hypothetical protein CEE44_04835 [Candidatus Woesearchaeota archaeon B3_Woes]|nr:MAG: hypothetical protein CEE44_04835 [Candidatus Woesearchaeota archaeon B3_Woes]
MRIKKEVDVVLMVVFVLLFFGFGSYIGLKDINGEKVVDVEAMWGSGRNAKEIIEEMPALIEEPEQDFRIIDIKDTKYSPSELDIPVGTTVFWVNSDPNRNYLVYERSANKRFYSSRIEPFENFSYTFDEKGTYYFNDGVFTYMHGVIRVS